MEDIFGCYHEIIPEFSGFQEILHNPLPTYIRVNRLKVGTDSVIKSLRGKGIHLEKASEKHDS
jgi:16S rRNA C967 or C1407 C5-methylase (RsmB/RsmF family)